MNPLTQLIFDTVVNPREVAQSLIAERFNQATVWTSVLFVVIVTGIVQFGLVSFAPPAPEPADPTAQQLGVMISYLLSTPFLATIVTGCVMIVAAFSVYLGGQMLGGTGQLLDVFALMTWINFVQAIVGLLQVVVLMVSPSLAGLASLLGFAAAAALFRSTLHFIDVVHSYDSLWAAFGTLVISFLGLCVGGAFIMALIGGAAIQTGAI